MERDPYWVEISKKLEKCRQQTKQSIMAHLSPPGLRSKARYLNLESLIKWFKKMELYKKEKGLKEIEKDLLEYGQRDKVTKKRKMYKRKEIKQKSRELYEEKFGWMEQYKVQFKEYEQYIEVISHIKQEISSKGLSKKSIEQIELYYKDYQLSCIASCLKNELIAELKKYIPAKAGQEEAYLCKSDIIESLFGKFKYLNNENSMMGLTQSVLLMAAITGKMDEKMVKEAMEYSTVNKIEQWTKENIGETVFSKRMKLMNLN
jgi:hypothetical protein